MEISIVIVHFRKPEMLKLCLNSLRQAIEGISHELIIIDSMARDNHRYIIEKCYPGAKYVPFDHNLGYSKGVNEGITRSQGNYILVLNHDVIVTQESIKKILAYMKQHPDIGIIGPKLLHFNDILQQSYFRFYTPLTIFSRRTFLNKLNYFRNIEKNFLMTDTDPEKIQTPDWVMGSFMFVSKKAIDRVGLMDSKRFFFYFEDVDWCRRMWLNGFKVVYYPDAIAYHYLGRGSKSRLGIFDALFNKKTHWHIKSAIRFFIKYRSIKNNVIIHKNKLLIEISANKNI